MTIQLGSLAPDFTQESTEGTIRFHDWIGDKWAILFSHPKDFTPVCTTELGTVAKLKGEFDKRNVKVIAVSVDDVDSHRRWIGDIEDTQKTKMNFPILGDTDRKVMVLVGDAGCGGARYTRSCYVWNRLHREMRGRVQNVPGHRVLIRA